MTDTKYIENPLSNLGEQEKEVSSPLAIYLQEKAKQEAKKAQEPSALERAFERLSRTPDGQLVLNWIMHECGYQATGIDLVNGEISKRHLIKNEAQRHIWCMIRLFIPHDVRHLIEDPKPRKENDENESKA